MDEYTKSVYTYFSIWKESYIYKIKRNADVVISMNKRAENLDRFIANQLIFFGQYVAAMSLSSQSAETIGRIIKFLSVQESLPFFSEQDLNFRTTLYGNSINPPIVVMVDGLASFGYFDAWLISSYRYIVFERNKGESYWTDQEVTELIRIIDGDFASEYEPVNPMPLWQTCRTIAFFIGTCN